jgi:predicted AlkP superfamily pyrophosphatase or phosphodiesterase
MTGLSFFARTVARAALVAFVALVLAACGGAPARIAQQAPAERDTLILVSIDGFRADYLDRGLTPRLSALAASGVRAQAMRPSFPSLTFPNHYTLVTGLTPDHHGIVHNVVEDPQLPGRFVYNKPETVGDPRWWNGGEPIWVGAQRQGVRTATMFWPGSDVVIRDTRPWQWRAFDKNVSPTDRVDAVLGWLALPAAERPRFVTLYFEQVDKAGHDYGPDSDELAAALAAIDAALGRLVDGLAQKGLDASTNLVIVSDHGMIETSRDRLIFVEDFVDLARIRAVNLGVAAGFEPQQGQSRYADATLLAPRPHMQCWRKKDVPARFRYGSHARVPAIVCLADPGWILTTREYLANRNDRVPAGEHGYDNADPRMAALFVAHGPAFRHGAVVPPFDNVDVYPLLAHLLGIRPAANDGDPATMRAMLATP